VLEQSAARIVARLPPDALVLDVGGGARPFSRADVVLDILPFERRGQLGFNGDRAEQRFSAQTWIQRDICDREPWPFDDKQFDFAVCSHTLEDVRDPVFVAGELQRVAAAGYIEVPSLREELTYGIQGPWVGWGHHRWLVFVSERGLEFLFKHHVAERTGSHLPAGALAGLTPEQRVQTLWWEERFTARERFMWTAEELDGFLESFVASASNGRPVGNGLMHRLMRRSSATLHRAG
jgi:Methyltransferase domain